MILSDTTHIHKRHKHSIYSNEQFNNLTWVSKTDWKMKEEHLIKKKYDKRK